MGKPTVKVERLIGFGQGSVEFLGRDERGGFRVAAYADGACHVFASADETPMDVTDEIRKAATKLLKAKERAKKPATFKGRAMSGTGVDR